MRFLFLYTPYEKMCGLNFMLFKKFKSLIQHHYPCELVIYFLRFWFTFRFFYYKTNTKYLCLMMLKNNCWLSTFCWLINFVLFEAKNCTYWLLFNLHNLLNGFPNDLHDLKIRIFRLSRQFCYRMKLEKLRAICFFLYYLVVDNEGLRAWLF